MELSFFFFFFSLGMFSGIFLKGFFGMKQLDCNKKG